MPPESRDNPDSPSTLDRSQLDRRDFIRVAGLGAGLLITGCGPEEEPVPGLHRQRRLPLIGRSSANVVVIGAGAWGGWTSYYLRRAGANVTLVDEYGPGNARSTSGDETRGIRSSYGDREGDSAELWTRWAREAIRRWQAWDDEWETELKTKLFHTTGDLIMRTEWEPFATRTREIWQKIGVPHEVMPVEEVRKRWPVIDTDDIGVVLSEPDAGVVRARRACQAVVSVFEAMGGRVVIGRARISRATGGRVQEVTLDSGETLAADTFVFACGPWLGKMFPELLGNRTRTPLGYVCYFGAPAGDQRFTYPNLPSFNFPGVTGWAVLPTDSRGFRVRGGIRAPAAPGGAAAGAAPASPSVPAAARGAAAAPATPAAPSPAQLDPDLSERWFDSSRTEGPRRFLERRFPLLKDAPILQTHACHYELTSSKNFILDRHPQLGNVWIAGGGNAEGFKFGPVVGDYMAQRVMGDEVDATIAAAFTIPAEEYDPPPTP